MSEKAKIISAWERFLRSDDHWDWDNKPVLRLLLPISSPVRMSDQDAAPVHTIDDVIQVTRHRMLYEGQWVSQIVGRFRDTTVILSGPGTE